MYIWQFLQSSSSMQTLYFATSLTSIQITNILHCDAIRSEQLENGPFHEPTTYEPHIQTSSKQILTFAGHEYGRVEVFKIKKRSLVQKLQPLEKFQFSNVSHLIASHCTRVSSGKFHTGISLKKRPHFTVFRSQRTRSEYLPTYLPTYLNVCVPLFVCEIYFSMDSLCVYFSMDSLCINFSMDYLCINLSMDSLCINFSIDSLCINFSMDSLCVYLSMDSLCINLSMDSLCVYFSMDSL